MPPNGPQCTHRTVRSSATVEKPCSVHIKQIQTCAHTLSVHKQQEAPHCAVLVLPLPFRAKWPVCLNQLCKAVLHPQVPQSIPVNVGQQGGVAGPSHVAQCLLILHPAVTRSVSGSGGFSCPQFPCLRPLPWNPDVPKPTASASLHPSDGTSV